MAIHSYGSETQGSDDGLGQADGTVGEVKAVVLRESISKMADDMEDSDKDTIYEGNSGTASVGISLHGMNPMATDTAAITAHNVTPTTTGERRLSDEVSGVNWEALERTEEQEPRNQDTEDVSTIHHAT